MKATKITAGHWKIGTHTIQKLNGNVFHKTIWALFDGDQKHNDPGVTKDVSLGGARIVTSTAFQVGEEVAVTLRTGSPDPGGFRPVRGFVTRSRTLDEENFLWRHEVAVRFHQPLDETTAFLN